MRFLSSNKNQSSRKSKNRISGHKVKSIKGIFLLISMITLGLLIYKGYNLLLVKNYYINGYNGSKKNSIENFLVNSKPQNYFLLNENDLLDTLNHLDKNIQITAVKKIFPDKLEIHIKSQNVFMRVIVNSDETTKIKKIVLDSPIEATSTASVKLNGEIKEFIISDTGMILDKTKDENLPKILISNESQINSLQNSTILNKIKEIQISLLKNAIQKEEIILIDNSIIVKQDIDIYFLFSSEKPIEIQVRSLQVILERFTIEGIKPKKIDLRFDKPVVLF